MTANEPSYDLQRDFDALPPTAYIETDRYCDHCGYNLRTQPLRRDPSTGLLLVRCPECGRLHAARDGATAGRVWLQRLGTLALFYWILLIFGMLFGLGAAEVGITFATLDELTTYQTINIKSATTSAPASGSQIISIGGTTIIQTGSTTTRLVRVIRDRYEHYTAFLTLVHTISYILGFLALLLLVVACHHWRKWGYLIPALLFPALLGGLVWFPWTFDNPQLADWSARMILSQNAAYFVGCLSATLFGRPFARTVVQLLLPPRLRQVLAFLWIADGKPPPVVRGN